MNNLRFFYHRWAASWGFGEAPPPPKNDDDIGVAGQVLRGLGGDTLPIPVNIVLGATFFFAGWFITKFSTVR